MGCVVRHIALLSSCLFKVIMESSRSAMEDFKVSRYWWPLFITCHFLYVLLNTCYASQGSCYASWVTLKCNVYLYVPGIWKLWSYLGLIKYSNRINITFELKTCFVNEIYLWLADISIEQNLRQCIFGWVACSQPDY